MQTNPIKVRVEKISNGSQDISTQVRIFELRAQTDVALPPFAAGAHIDVEMQDGMVRQYSLLNDPSETDRYVVAVALAPESRGGSQYMHSTVNVGDTLMISTPRCHFALTEEAPFTILIAGGIGVTPLWAMAQRLLAIKRPFSFYFGARSRNAAPLLDIISPRLAAAGIPLVTAFESAGAYLDLAEIFRNAPAGAHFYACGPAGMLDAYIKAGQERPSETIHYERFSAPVAQLRNGGFEVELARTGGCYAIPPGQTILEALKAKGINVPHSCAEGICGACETVILEGKADHRDSVLSDAEKAEGKSMMVCCSGALSPRLVLDL